MKTLILTLLLASPLLANNVECETALSMFQFSLEQGYPITDELLITAINTCEGVSGHEGLVSVIELMLETTIEA